MMEQRPFLARIENPIQLKISVWGKKHWKVDGDFSHADSDAEEEALKRLLRLRDKERGPPNVATLLNKNYRFMWVKQVVNHSQMGGLFLFTHMNYMICGRYGYSR